MMRPAVLSPGFGWGVVEASATAAAQKIDNTLPELLYVNAARTAQFLECVLALVGAFQVNSWYRCPALNAAIGGSRGSAHLLALAVDIHPVNLSLEVAFERIRASALPYDQVIVERTKSGAAWLHIGLSIHPPRREALKAEGTAVGGPMTFTRVAVG